MTTELTNLAWVSALTGLLWVPYILNRLAVGKGVLHDVGYPSEATKLSPWAERLKRAHDNAVENFAVFAPLVLVAHAAGVHTQATGLAAAVYLWARVAHAASYTFAVPWVRTIAFTVGWVCQMAFARAVFSRCPSRPSRRWPARSRRARRRSTRRRSRRAERSPRRALSSWSPSSGCSSSCTGFTASTRARCTRTPRPLRCRRSTPQVLGGLPRARGPRRGCKRRSLGASQPRSRPADGRSGIDADPGSGRYSAGDARDRDSPVGRGWTPLAGCPIRRPRPPLHGARMQRSGPHADRGAIRERHGPPGRAGRDHGRAHARG